MHHLNGFLGTICSTGKVSLWATSIETKKLTLICTTIDESVRPTCIKLIDTTDNRYKQKQASIDAGILKDSLPRSTKRSRPIATAGKVIVEVEGSENKKTRLTSITDDSTDIQIVKKTPKMKKNVSSNVVVPTSTPTADSNVITPTSSKKKAAKLTFRLATKPAKPIAARSLNSDDDFESKTKRSVTKKKTPQKAKKMPMEKTTPQKQIVVRSVNSDDDFENPEARRSNKKKKKNSVGNTVEPATEMETPQKSFSTTPQQKQRNGSDFNVTDSQENGNLSSTSFHDGTPAMDKKKKKQATPMSCPTGTQQNTISQNSAKKSSKVSNKAKASPTHLMATRNKRKSIL